MFQYIPILLSLVLNIQIDRVNKYLSSKCFIKKYWREYYYHSTHILLLFLPVLYIHINCVSMYFYLLMTWSSWLSWLSPPCLREYVKPSSVSVAIRTPVAIVLGRSIMLLSYTSWDYHTYKFSSIKSLRLRPHAAGNKLRSSAISQQMESANWELLCLYLHTYLCVWVGVSGHQSSYYRVKVICIGVCWVIES